MWDVGCALWVYWVLYMSCCMVQGQDIFPGYSSCFLKPDKSFVALHDRSAGLLSPVGSNSLYWYTEDIDCIHPRLVLRTLIRSDEYLRTQSAPWRSPTINAPHTCKLFTDWNRTKRSWIGFP